MSRANIPLNFISHMRHASQLSRLLAEAKQRDDEQSRLGKLLPPALRDQVLITQDDDCLCLTVRNNAVAQMLHFQKPLLLAASGCAQLRVRIDSIDNPFSTAAQPPQVERQLSANSAQLLLAAADDFEDQALADVFRRLAQHAGTTKP